MMISEFFINLGSGFLSLAPVLALPAGFGAGIGFLVDVVGYINVWLPLVRLAPIIGFVVMVRNWNIIVSFFRFVLQLIPFVG